MLVPWVSRRLGETGKAIVASPGYLQRHGTSRNDLKDHNLLGSSYRRNLPDWPLHVKGRAIAVPVGGNVGADDGETLRQLALAGVGSARLSRYHVHDDLLASRLVAVLEAFNPNEAEPILAVYLGKASRLPARVRAVLDFLLDQVNRSKGFASAPAPRRRG